MLVPFQSNQVTSPVAQGRYWVGMSDRYRIHLANLHGDTLQVVDRETDPVRVTQAERDSILELATVRRIVDAGGVVDVDLIPDAKPYFRAIWMDDMGHVWVLLSREHGEEGERMDVFDSSGRYLGQVEADQAFEESPVPVVRAGMLWAHVQDAWGVSSVVGMRIVRDR